MFRCLGRLGCLAIVVLIAVGAYLTRDRWLDRLRGRRAAPITARGGPVWEPLTSAGAERARVAVRSLGGRTGPVYANVRPADIASYIFFAVARQLPSSATGTEAAIIGDQLHVRTVLALRDLGGASVLGSLGGFLAERDTVQLGGTFEVVRTGLAQFRVQEVRLRQLSLPRKMIPRVVSTLRKGARPPGITDDGLALEIPSYIGDVRIGRGEVTLYRTPR